MEKVFTARGRAGFDHAATQLFCAWARSVLPRAQAGDERDGQRLGQRQPALTWSDPETAAR
jgi:hypothetical protein